ncbi:MAG: peptidoglycan DD-metalloendopeptidase family protein [Candidatus Devosia symbiotica]|nr:peptidoglycan DD-metalloendopeptidase family protein [Candidatus Devosia symbiotica]
MSIRVSRWAPKSAVAMAGLLTAAVALSGCSGFSSRAFSDPTATGSLPQAAPQSFNQPMPASLGAPQVMVAEAQFVPPANVGGGAGVVQAIQPLWGQSTQSAFGQPIAPLTGGTVASVQSQNLPVLSNSSQGSIPAMQAQSSAASAIMPSPAALSRIPINSSMPTLAAVTPAAPASDNTFTHTIASGESLYTIARLYEVTTQSLVQANNLASPDKIVVGQKVIIPGRSDLIATKAPVTKTASADSNVAPVPAKQTLSQAAPNALQTSKTTVVAPAPALAPAPVTVAAAPAAEPVISGNDKFRWPVSGRVLVDFAGSKGAGINIEAAEGAPIKAAENGTVIYVGSGVEGYGNLILIRHPNGYVSAYAHLGIINVAKGTNVGRGDTIGAAGKTGSVTKPQLHFELRKGATPVDPVPLLVS